MIFDIEKTKHLPYALKGHWDHDSPSVENTSFSNTNKNTGNLNAVVTTHTNSGIADINSSISYTKNLMWEPKEIKNSLQPKDPCTIYRNNKFLSYWYTANWGLSLEPSANPYNTQASGDIESETKGAQQMKNFQCP